MTSPDLFRRVAETLLYYPSCLIATHINPEGDAIGSQLALAMALEQFGKTVYCYDRDGVPEICRFLPTWERVHRELPAEIPPLVIYVDADRLERCNLSVAQLSSARDFVRIDHHSGGMNEGLLTIVDPTAAATGELIYALLPALGARVTPQIATCLLAALMVDTGRFSYTNTTPTTLHTAAELVAAGADLTTIVDWTWGRVSFPASKLLGFALSSLQLSPNGQVAWAVLRQEDFQSVNANAEDTEGIIDHIRAVRDIQVGALFSEKTGLVRVSLRSNGAVDVARIARFFNGGGHAKAAGLTYEGLIEHAVCDVLQAIDAALADAG